MGGQPNGDWRLPPYYVTDANCTDLKIDEDDIAAYTQSRLFAQVVDDLEKIKCLDLIRKSIPNFTDTEQGALEAMLE